VVLRALIVAALLAAPAEQLGRSYEGRPIEVVHVAGKGPRILVVGCIHGDECEGIEVTRLLERSRPKADLWLLHQLNPDGYARRSLRKRPPRRPQPRLPRGNAAGDTDRAEADPPDEARCDDLVPPTPVARAGMGRAAPSRAGMPGWPASHTGPGSGRPEARRAGKTGWGSSRSSSSSGPAS